MGINEYRYAYYKTFPIEVSDRGGTGVAVYLQDQTTESLDVHFINDRGTFTVASDTTIDSRVFTATAGHNIVVGEVVEFANTTTFMQAEVLAVDTNTITLDTPFNHAYSTSDTMNRGSIDMQVDGSTTPVVFAVTPLSHQSGDITRVIFTIESTSAMDYTTFGSIAALTNGCVLRVKRSNGDYRNIVTFKSNGDYIEHSFDNLFQEKVGGGGYGFVGRSSFGGQSNRGVVIRLDGALNESLELVVQDDLSTGLTKLNMVAQGSELQGD